MIAIAFVLCAAEFSRKKLLGTDLDKDQVDQILNVDRTKWIRY